MVLQVVRLKRCKVVIMGAAGRDFHNFNTYFRDDEHHEVVAFTATQIPNIEGRRYPPELAGKLYPNGIQIVAEEKLPELIREHGVEQVVFAYSDISHLDLMHKASMVLALGADFRLMGNQKIVLRSKVPVISVCAVRTGSGKSQTTRKICKILRAKGLDVVAVRHPMPYGDLVKQTVQRFATYADMDKFECTIEEQEADVIVWDGGNNDTSFYRSDLYITIADPHRPGHEVTYHPGETNVRMADVVIINKVQTADRKDILTVKENVSRLNPRALIIEAASPIRVDDPKMIKGKRVLVVEDGPTVTHGGMSYGAGTIAAQDYGAAEIIDPRPHAVGSIAETFAKYKHIGKLLPAMGYSKEQVIELEETINSSGCEVVVAGTPVDLRRVIKVNVPIARVYYELEEIGRPTLEEIIEQRLGKMIREREN